MTVTLRQREGGREEEVLCRPSRNPPHLNGRSRAGGVTSQQVRLREQAVSEQRGANVRGFTETIPLSEN